MSDDEMIAKFLETNEVKQIESNNFEYTDDIFNKTKSHRNRKDYITEPMWNKTRVYQDDVLLELNIVRHKTEFTTSLKQNAMSWFYSITDVKTGAIKQGGQIRENTINKRISDGIYKLAKED